MYRTKHVLKTDPYWLGYDLTTEGTTRLIEELQVFQSAYLSANSKGGKAGFKVVPEKRPYDNLNKQREHNPNIWAEMERFAAGI